MRWYPRTLAGQVAALALTVVTVVVVAGSVLAAIDARVDGDRAARDEVTAVAVSLAQAPSTVSALTSPDPSAILQPVTDRIRRETGIAFITVLGPDRTRYTHTDPYLIGALYIGSIDAALRGETITETYTGTLGPSIRTITPVRGPDGRIIGMVAAGITQRSLTSTWRGELPRIAVTAVAALLTAAAGVWWIRRRLLRQTGGLAPGDLRLMYDHHDAVLHAIREGLIVVEAGRPAGAGQCRGATSAGHRNRHARRRSAGLPDPRRRGVRRVARRGRTGAAGQSVAGVRTTRLVGRHDPRPDRTGRGDGRVGFDDPIRRGAPLPGARVGEPAPHPGRTGGDGAVGRGGPTGDHRTRTVPTPHRPDDPGGRRTGAGRVAPG